MKYKEVDKRFPVQYDSTRHMTQTEYDSYGHAIDVGFITIVDANGNPTGTVYDASGFAFVTPLPLGAATSILTPTGSVNSVNTDFVFTSEPALIIADGLVLKKGAGWSWTVGTLTATMDVPPNYSLFGIV